MEAYLEEAFNVEKFSGELKDSNCEFYFLYCNEKIAGYLKLNETPSVPKDDYFIIISVSGNKENAVTLANIVRCRTI